jgi:hypothetical protein
MDPSDLVAPWCLPIDAASNANKLSLKIDMTDVASNSSFTPFFRAFYLHVKNESDPKRREGVQTLNPCVDPSHPIAVFFGTDVNSFLFYFS